MHTVSCGEKIEESHYMERSWAALLTVPLQHSLERAMTCATQKGNVTQWLSGAFVGRLENCACPEVHRCREASRAASPKLWTSEGASAHRVPGIPVALHR